MFVVNKHYKVDIIVEKNDTDRLSDNIKFAAIIL